MKTGNKSDFFASNYTQGKKKQGEALLKTRKKNGIGCDEARELMFEYLDGELDPGTSAKLSAHLMECPDCERELDECRRMLEEIRKVEYPAPGALRGNVMALVGCTPQEKPSRFKRIVCGWRFTTAVGTVAAACAVIALVVFNRGVINANTGKVESLEKGNAVVGAAYQSDTKATETVGALQFSAPKTTDDDTDAPTTVRVESFDYSGAADTTSLLEKPNLKKSLSDDDITISLAVENFIKSDTAVLIVPVDSKVGSDVGNEVTIAGLEKVNCREYNGGDASEVMMTLESELLSDGIEFQPFVPDSEFDCLVIMNSAPITNFSVETAIEETPDAEAVAENAESELAELPADEPVGIAE